MKEENLSLGCFVFLSNKQDTFVFEPRAWAYFMKLPSFIRIVDFYLRINIKCERGALR